MIWRIEITDKPGVFDALGESVLKDLADLGISSVKDVRVTHVYLIDGDLSVKDAQRIAAELLVDPVVQDYRCISKPSELTAQARATHHEIEIAYLPGVMDPVEMSTLKGIRDLGLKNVQAVRTAKRYALEGKLTSAQVDLITQKVLMNKLIQRSVTAASTLEPVALPKAADKKVRVITVDLLEADDKQLEALSAQGQLFLNLNEMKAIQAHFKSLGRNPTDIELETVAQTWSEHCHHKTFRGLIDYTCTENGKTSEQRIDSLIKQTIFKATHDLKKDWCVSVFHDNAGIIEFDDQFNVCFKVETHNHPSALEPFGGANTGVGGVIRDTLGTGLGAKPICNTDVFCFAPPDTDMDDVPVGSLHPKRVMKGVVSGVRDYGNKMGIPTVNGSILFDHRFIGNPLVFCGNVGLIPIGKDIKKPMKGDKVVVLGGRVGRDGIHGATFSSGELTSESETVSSGAVQIGNPIEEKKVTDVLLQARDKGLYTAVTDCGAGGLSSAVGEMGEVLGARVDLEKSPIKYEGLKYHEIWISESQERIVLSVPPKKVDEIMALFAQENVEAAVLGEFPGTGRLELFYHGTQVCDLDMDFLYNGIPKVAKKAVWEAPKPKKFDVVCPTNLTDALADALAHYNVCSKEWVVRQYDHEVQGTSIVKPFVGLKSDGPSDAAVLRPRLDGKKGIAVANGINVRFGMIDPFWMAASCIDEAIRQVIAVGARFDRIAVLDNFCWGNPDKPDRLGGLVRCSQGCYEAAVEFGVPFISGKDSLYNEYAENGKSLAIPGTLLISSIGIVDDVERALTMDVKTPGNLLYAVGNTYDELGGSIYLDNANRIGSDVPKVRFEEAKATFKAMASAIRKGYVRSAHDCSEGGIAVTLAEMAFSGGFGITVRASRIPYKGKMKRNDAVLFSESNSRFIVEVDPKNQKKFEEVMTGVALGCIGTVEESKECVIYGLDEKVCVSAFIDDLKKVWKAPLNLS